MDLARPARRHPRRARVLPVGGEQLGTPRHAEMRSRYRGRLSAQGLRGGSSQRTVNAMSRHRRPPRRVPWIAGGVAVLAMGGLGVWTLVAQDGGTPDPTPSASANLSVPTLNPLPPWTPHPRASDKAGPTTDIPAPKPTMSHPRQPVPPSDRLTPRRTAVDSSAVWTPRAKPTATRFISSEPSRSATAPRQARPSALPATDGHEPMITTWYTSPAAVAAAERMAAVGAVGDPVCSMAAVGQPDPDLVPQGGRIGIGTSRNYWCLIW